MCINAHLHEYSFIRVPVRPGRIGWSAGSARRTDGRGPDRKAGLLMKLFCRQTLALALGALALGILVFFLLYTGTLALSPTEVSGRVFFTLVSALSGGGLLVLTAGVLRANRSPALADGWLCCGETAAVSALGTLLTVLLTSLTASTETGLYVGTALCCFFLFLFFGSLICFLRRYLTARFSC